MQTHINVVAVLRLVGLLVGIVGEPPFLMSGCILIGSSLIAKPVHYRVRE